jgi:hypothetical protein
MSPYSACGSNFNSVFLGFAPRGRTQEPYLDFLLCVRVAQTQGKKNIFSRRAPTEEAKGRQLDVEEENWVQTSSEGCKK